MKNCNSCIVLWRDEIDVRAWEDYCEKFDVPTNAQKIVIYFNDKNLEYEYGEEDNK